LIGVFDSGIGGLSVLKALRAELPQHDFVYLADSGHAPYGERSDDYVLARSEAVAAHLCVQGANALVIACNTATAVAVTALRAAFPQLPIIGVEPALKPALALTRTGRIGVMATRATLASARFKQLLASLPTSSTFVLQPCDGLASAIELSVQSGDSEAAHAAVRALCIKHTQAMGAFGECAGEIDTLVLGCTHYPFAADALQGLVGAHVQLLDTGAPVARQTRLRLGLALKSGATSVGELRFQTTGDAAWLDSAVQRWLGLTASAVQVDV
jgi:glutamate racemase